MLRKYLQSRIAPFCISGKTRQPMKLVTYYKLQNRKILCMQMWIRFRIILKSLLRHECQQSKMNLITLKLEFQIVYK
uniref:Uncharacterized protein n=1 Tax=Pararge aegeria TaxID=116150 RepID=S4P1W0_9NEOP